jgi:predicted GNAT family acetyltransferase
MEISRPRSVSEFLDRGGIFLARHEAEHGLMLGVARAARELPSDGYCALVVNDGDVLGAALRIDSRLMLSRELAPDVMALVAADASSPKLQRVLGPSQSVERFLAASGSRWRAVMSQGIYECRRVSYSPRVAGECRLARADDLEQLVLWLQALSAEALSEHVSDSEARRRVGGHIEHGDTRVWEVEGQIVSVAAAVAPTPRGIRINNVYTPPEQRRRGYATALVAALTQEMLASGRAFTFLHTDLENPTSNGLYQRLGYQKVSDFRVAELSAIASS